MEKQGLQRGRKIVIGASQRGNMIQLERSYGSDRSDIPVGVFEPIDQGPHQVLHQILNPKGAQAPESQAADHGIVILAVPLQEIDGEQGQIRVATRVIADVEVTHFFQNEI